MMPADNRQPRSILKAIARRAMLERGFLPDFSPQALAELDGISGPAIRPGESTRDLRSLLWCSIDNDELRALAKHCTEEEDAAKKVERQVVKSAAALLLESRIGEQFDALVTGASDKGTWVRILQPPVEGRLESGFQGLDVGHRLRVRLTHTDVARGFINFKRAV